MHESFLSPTELKGKLMDTFKGKLPSTYDFQIGYFTKKGNSKRWIEQEADLVSMYGQFENSDTITIFCDGKQKEAVGQARKRKRTTDDDAGSASDHEEKVRHVAEQLSEKHGDKWDQKQYLLWARMYVNKQWKSLDEEPDIPLLRGGLKKVPRKESISDAITGAAIAFAKALTPQNTPTPTPTKQSSGTHSPLPTGVSPASKAKLSSTYISQLRELQELRESGVLSEEEFQEQKMFALNNIRGMNK